MMAQVCGLQVWEFVHTYGDAHLYSNQFEQTETQLVREPGDLPTLWLNPEIDNLFDFTFDDIKIKDYNPQAPIKAKVAV